ncbi:MAG: nitric oxide synthase oxygenase [Pseudomonadota bacterium]|jgi:nitric-oxide synthase
MRAFGSGRLSSDPLRRRLRRPSPHQRREEAVAFIKRFHEEMALPDEALVTRLRDVRRDLSRHGFYRHTPDELAFGARIAWRNHANCIGRLHWKALEVFDCRSIRNADDIAVQLLQHLRSADANGRIRSQISIFAPVEGDDTPPWIESAQLVRYAGYSDGQGGLQGDPANVELTRTAMQMGWEPPVSRSDFDILPLIIRDEEGRRNLYELPDGSVREVDITHPSIAGLADLKLKWYAVPVVCDMILTIGGIDYPCAPFNGYYMGTEIASRNLLDLPRYNLMDRAADALAVNRADPLYKDRVSTELNHAVLCSFARDNVTITDHHQESDHFIQFIHREKAAGRMPSANWSWIVPPEASATCPVFHQPMQDYHDVPNFYRSSASDGAMLGVSYATEDLNRFQRRFQRVRRRFRSWVRSKS